MKEYYYCPNYLCIDIDNLPVPEYILDAVTESSGVNEWCIKSNDTMQEWKRDGLHFRKIREAQDYKASLKKSCADEMRFTKLQYLDLVIPEHYFIPILLSTMN